MGGGRKGQGGNLGGGFEQGVVDGLNGQSGKMKKPISEEKEKWINWWK